MRNMYRKKILFVHRQLPVRMALNAHISTLPVHFVSDYNTKSSDRKEISQYPIASSLVIQKWIP